MAKIVKSLEQLNEETYSKDEVNDLIDTHVHSVSYHDEPSKLINTIYTNNTGYDITVMVSFTRGTSDTVSINIDGAEVSHDRTYDVANYVSAPTFIVPDGLTYQIINTGASAALRWFEIY